MTLILSCLTPKYIVQVSDRRLTWADGRVADDAANKAIVFHDRACFCYTGIAQIGAQRTDEWITDKLTGCKGVQDAIDTLKRELDARIVKLGAPNRHLTVGIDFWGTQDASLPDRPWSVALTNQIDPGTRKWSKVPRATFQQFNQTLPADKGYAFLPLGQGLDMGIYRSMVRNLVRAMRHAGDSPSTVMPETVGRFMREAILYAAAGNGAVGKNLMMTVLLNRQVAENEGVSNSFSYHRGDGSEPILYAPTLISPGMIMKGFKMYAGPPRFKIK
jgi:hypothetical protein